MTTRTRSSSMSVMSPGRLGSTSAAIKTETRTTPWLNDFTVITTIGRGKFAVVKKCVEKTTDRHFAAKCIRKRRYNRDCTPDIFHEIAVLEISASQSYLINLYRVYESPNEVILILEYAAGGEIFDHCVGVKDTFSETTSRRLLRQILEAVAFLHDNDIVHLDLKPQNILLTKEGTDPDADIRLVDFGLSKYITNGLEIREILGTPDYVAPEVLNYEPISIATDIWSMGVVSYVMLTGVSPFLGDTKQETLMNVTTALLEFPPDLFENLSPACQDLMFRMMQRDPSNRLTARESLSHQWITGIMSPVSSLTIQNERNEELTIAISSEDVFSGEEARTNTDSGIESPLNEESCDIIQNLMRKEENKSDHSESTSLGVDCFDANGNVTNDGGKNLFGALDTSQGVSCSIVSQLATGNSLAEITEENENDNVFPPSPSKIDFNGNLVEDPSDLSSSCCMNKSVENDVESTKDEKSESEFFGKIKRRLSSDCLQTPGTCVTGTNFANVRYQEPINIPVVTAESKDAGGCMANHVTLCTSPSVTDKALDCCRTFCPIPYCPKAIVTVVPSSQLVSPRNDNVSRRNSNKENVDLDSCDKKMSAKSICTTGTAADSDHSPSPTLTRLTLTSCTNSPVSTLKGPSTVRDQSEEDNSLNITQHNTPNSFKSFNITVHVPRTSCFMGSNSCGNVSKSEENLPSTSLYMSPSNHPKDSKVTISVPDPSLKRRKFDFIDQTDTGTEIKVAD